MKFKIKQQVKLSKKAPKWLVDEIGTKPTTVIDVNEKNKYPYLTSGYSWVAAREIVAVD